MAEDDHNLGADAPQHRRTGTGRQTASRRYLLLGAGIVALTAGLLSGCSKDEPRSAGAPSTTSAAGDTAGAGDAEDHQHAQVVEPPAGGVVKLDTLAEATPSPGAGWGPELTPGEPSPNSAGTRPAARPFEAFEPPQVVAQDGTIDQLAPVQLGAGLLPSALTITPQGTWSDPEGDSNQIDVAVSLAGQAAEGDPTAETTASTPTPPSEALLVFADHSGPGGVAISDTAAAPGGPLTDTSAPARLLPGVGDDCPATADTIPMVGADPSARRWVVALWNATTHNLCVSVSDVAGPNAPWTTWVYPLTTTLDLPALAMWPNQWVIGSGSVEGDEVVIALDRTSLLRGRSAKAMIGLLEPQKGERLGRLVPADWQGDPGAQLPEVMPDPMFVRILDGRLLPGADPAHHDFVDIWTMQADFTAGVGALNEQRGSETSEWDLSGCQGTEATCLAGPEGTSPVNPLLGSVSGRAVYHHSDRPTLSLAFPVQLGPIPAPDAPGRIGVHWMQIRRSSGGEWEHDQEGTMTVNDSRSRFSPALTVDRTDGVLVAYATIGPDAFPGLAVAGRQRGDADATLSTGELPIGNPTTGALSPDWAPATATRIDPADGCTVWVAGRLDRSIVLSTARFEACT